MKNTSLAFVASLVDLTAEGQIIAGSNYRYFEIYLSLSIIYWILTIITERILKVLENRLTIFERAAELGLDTVQDSRLFNPFVRNKKSIVSGEVAR